MFKRPCSFGGAFNLLVCVTFLPEIEYRIVTSPNYHQESHGVGWRLAFKAGGCDRSTFLSLFFLPPWIASNSELLVPRLIHCALSRNVWRSGRVEKQKAMEKGGTTGVPRDAMGQGPLVTQQDVTMDATCFLSNRIQHGFVEPSDHRTGTPLKSSQLYSSKWSIDKPWPKLLALFHLL